MGPFSEQLAWHLEARFGAFTPSEATEYAMDPVRVEEADDVEEIAWAFRCSEVLSQVPSDGPGRLSPGAPRLVNCIATKRFRGATKLDRMALVATLSDEWLAWGYELGIGKEAEGVATILPPEQFDASRGWLYTVAGCQVSVRAFDEAFEFPEGLLEDAHRLATSNADRFSRDAGLKPKRELAATTALLVNAGLLMRSAQNSDADACAQLASERLEEARECWPTPISAAQTPA